MKKITLLITLLLMAGLMLVACGGGTTTPTTTEETAPETSTEVEEPVEEVVEEPAEEVAEEPVEEPAEEMAEEPVEEPAAETEASSGDRVQVRWFVGLGTGGSEPQIERQNAVVEEFNASQDEIELVLEIVQNEVARDALATLIASGDAPDIVGPVGNEGAYFFPDTWLDLQPLIDSSGYDLSQYPETSVEFYRTADGGLDGIPFAVFPAMIFYNVDLFDEAGLNYPPHVVGEPYVMPDGTEVPWNFDTLAEVAKMLTVDANGNDATSPDFDRENIVQFGYHNQWIQTIRALCNPYGPAELIDADGNAVWPDSYQECIDYMHNAIWVDNFAPNQAQQDSELLATPNQFGSGNVGMALTHLWFTCCLVDAPVSNWDLAVAPANSSGETAVKLHADTYRIYRGTEVPEEAFTVLTYLLGEAAPSLLEVYGALPIRADEQAAFFASQDELYTQGVDWSVVNESLNYVESPGHESNMPNYTEAVTRTNALYSLLFTDGAADLDAEIATFLTDLQAIFDAAQ